MKLSLEKSGQFSALIYLLMTAWNTTGCSKPQNTIILPARACVPNPFSSAKSTSGGGKTLGIVNGSTAGNSDPLEKTVVGIIMEYDLDTGATSGGTCTGVVAGKDVVISAAHCFQPPPNATATRVFVTFRQELRDLTLNDVIPVDRVLPHPNYTGARLNYSNADIAVLKLKNAVPSTQLVASFVANPATLTPGLGVTAIGYGVTGSTNRDSGIKRKADSFVSNLIDSTNYPSSPLRDQVRVVDSSGSLRGACYGDSGGPGFVRGKAEVFGVVQGIHGSVQGPAPSCEKADYNYTLVAPFRSWIEQQIGYSLNVSGAPLSVTDSPGWGGVGGKSPTGEGSSAPSTEDVAMLPDAADSAGSSGSRSVAASSTRASSSQSVLPYCK